MNPFQILLIACVFAGVFIAGMWLANATKEELNEGRKYFRILVKLCLLFLAVSAAYGLISGFSEEILIGIFSLSAMLIIALISFKIGKSRR